MYSIILIVIYFIVFYSNTLTELSTFRNPVSWLPTQEMLADVLTKEMKIPQALEDVILKNKISISQPLVNEVKAVGTEIRMVNIHNR